MRSYLSAFITTLVTAIVLAAALGYVAWHYALHQGMPSAMLKGQSGAVTVREPGTAGDGSSSGITTPSPQTPLAPVELSPEQLQSIGVKTGKVERQRAFNEIRAVGNVAVDERLLATVQTRFSGWIQKVYADATYQYVRKGQPLFTIYSPELVTTEQEFLLAKKNRALLAKSSVPGVAAGADSLFSAAEERLTQWQIPSREIERLESTGQVRHEIEIDSPVSGYITERNALPNLFVQPATQLYTVAGLSTVWVLAEVFQNDIGQIKTGDRAEVTSDAYPGRTFYGLVDFIYPEVDMTTRTAKVRLLFVNPSLKLTPGMFVNVSLKIPLGSHVMIPASGVLQSGTQDLVFVDHGGGYLEPRSVQLGPRVGDQFIVLKGLHAGERIVTSANFLIDSESQLQAALGSFAPPPPGAGAAAAMNAPGAQATIEFATTPSPPHKGRNTFQVKLTRQNGKSVTGTDVTVTFFMPAMPAMGMAAMRVIAKLADRGNGMYEGSGELKSGGTWQVTVVAQKDGQTIASKQLSVNATGGM